MEALSLSGDPRNFPALIFSIPFINNHVSERVPQELKDSRKFDPSKSNAIQVTMVTCGGHVSYISTAGDPDGGEDGPEEREQSRRAVCVKNALVITMMIKI